MCGFDDFLDNVDTLGVILGRILFIVCLNTLAIQCTTVTHSFNDETAASWDLSSSAYSDSQSFRREYRAPQTALRP